jgi:spore coat polysaccharide biosynthesis protein SpsF
MKIVTIVQARMGSSRLPGKVMLDLMGSTVLARVVQRLRRAKFTGELVIATTRNRVDDVIVSECDRIGVKVFRGEEEDVLDRYYGAARAFNADVIVRITSDCPLIEPEISDHTIRAFLERLPDYASNTLQRTFPRGMDTEIVTAQALMDAWKSAKQPYQRSHVTAYIYENPGLFDLLSVPGKVDHSWQRWTLDTPEDLRFIRAVYEHMDDPDNFNWLDVLSLLEQNPELLELNSHVTQKTLQEG